MPEGEWKGKGRGYKGKEYKKNVGKKGGKTVNKGEGKKVGKKNKLPRREEYNVLRSL